MELPQGWLDTGITKTFVLQAAVNMRKCSTYGDLLVVGPTNTFRLYVQAHPTVGSGLMYSTGTFGNQINAGSGSAAWSRVQWRLSNVTASFDDVMDTQDGACTPDWFGGVVAKKTVGPLRLGVTVEVAGNSRRRRYAWFWDDATTETVQVHTTRTDSATGPAIPALYTPGFQMGFLHNTFQIAAQTTISAFRFAQITGDLALLDVGGPPLPFTNPSASMIEAPQYNTGPFGGHYFTFYPNFVWNVDVDVRHADGSAIAAQIDYDPALGGATYSTPHVAAQSRRQMSWDFWDGENAVSLNTAWRAAQEPPVPAEEAPVPIRHSGPKDPAGAGSAWAPVTVEFAGSLAVLRSAGTFSGAGPVAVSGSGNRTWTVSGAGASVTRDLTESWRDWGTIGHGDFEAQGYRVTKADYGDTTDDRWGWASYAYLDVDLTAPSAGTLTFIVTGAHALWDYFTGELDSETPYTRVYSLPVTSGRHTYRVDLLFPDAGGPEYHERVDTVAFSGFATGVYELHTLTLTAAEDGYLKTDYSGIASGMVYAQDGAYVMGLWGGDPANVNIPHDRMKRDENFEPAGVRAGGAIPWQERTLAGSDTLLVRTLAAYAADLNRIEGFTVTIDESEIDADLTDGFGNALGNPVDARRSLWLDPLMPARRIALGSPEALAASYVSDTLQIPVGAGVAGAVLFTLRGRKILGGVLEGLADQNGQRGPAGRTVNAVRTDTSAVVASSVTDASGYVQIGVLANGARAYRLEAA